MHTALQTPATRACIIFGLILLSGSLMAWLIKPLLLHVICAVSLYILLQPVTGALIRANISDSLSALIVLAGLIFLSALASALLIPRLIDQFAQLQEQMPTIIQTSSELAESLKNSLSAKFGVQLSTESMTAPVVDTATQWSKDALLQISNFALTLFGMAVIVPLLAYFLLRDYRTLRNRLMQWLPNSSFELGWIIYYRVARQLQEYVRGVMLQSGIMGTITTIGFSLLGLDLAILLGALTGMLNIIPYVGPLLAMIPPCVVILGDPEISFAMVGAVISVIITAQIIDNVVVVPVVIADAVNLHPLTVIIGVVIFGHFFGFIGMVIAIPVLASLKILFNGLIQGLKGRSSEDNWLQDQN